MEILDSSDHFSSNIPVFHVTVRRPLTGFHESIQPPLPRDLSNYPLSFFNLSIVQRHTFSVEKMKYTRENCITQPILINRSEKNIFLDSIIRSGHLTTIWQLALSIRSSTAARSSSSTRFDVNEARVNFRPGFSRDALHYRGGFTLARCINRKMIWGRGLKRAFSLREILCAQDMSVAMLRSGGFGLPSPCVAPQVSSIPFIGKYAIHSSHSRPLEISPRIPLSSTPFVCESLSMSLLPGSSSFFLSVKEAKENL